jgi:hypothetical protein
MTSTHQVTDLGLTSDREGWALRGHDRIAYR